jgi:hypothetical protein
MEPPEKSGGFYFNFAAPMKLHTGYIYHFITAALFVFFAAGIWFFPQYTGNIASQYRGVLSLILLLWGLFRAMNGYFAWKRSRREKGS